MLAARSTRGWPTAEVGTREMSASDTIFSLASAPGRAGLAVMRLSGPGAGPALARLTGWPAPPPARRASLATLRAPDDGEVLDRGLVLWFPAPASFTGEDVVELHLHGGLAVRLGVGEALAALPGLRPAEPGEFSRRAFLSGKMDLTEAEGLADLVDAETGAQRRQALRQLAGGLSARYDAWRDELIGILAEVEAAIDFGDEADVPANPESVVRARIGSLVDSFSEHLADGQRGERLREGLHIAILGPPNVGKSSLLNALAGRDAAIVAATAGTTRDVIEVHMDLGGYPAILSDTAGLRETADAVENEGLRRALARAETADLKVLVVEAGQAAEQLRTVRGWLDGDALLVANKTDLDPAPAVLDGAAVFGVSVLTGAGFDGLIGALSTEVARRLEISGPAGLTRARHRAAVSDGLDGLCRASKATELELMAEDLRLAARSIGRITGRVDVEDILDVVFSSFCIGK